MVKRFLHQLESEEHPEFFGISPLDVNSHGPSGTTPLHMAAYRRDVEAARALIDCGAKIDAVGDLGKQPLHEAAARGALEVCRLLVELGAQLDRTDEIGFTPETLAKRAGHAVIAKIISSEIERRKKSAI